MSIEKVARLAGVSTATVSRVLNGYSGVRPATRERVLAAIAASQYQPNLLARQLRTSQSRMLLVLVSNIINPFCSHVVRGIEAEAEAHGYHILLCNSDSQPQRESAYLALLSGKVVDGVITMDAVTNLPGLRQMIGDSPWVQCAEGNPDAEASSVTIDNHQAGREAVAHLAQQGRQRIAMINGDPRYLYAQQREMGYRAALTAHNLNWGGVEYANEVECEAGYAAMARLLDRGDPPDAIFAVSDVLAVGAIHCIRQRQLRVPEDIAVLGFDGLPWSAMLSPPLSTLEQPMHQLGVRSVQMLLQRIRDPRAPRIHEQLSCQLIVRASSQLVPD
ncbi:LacI family DNA-binding transcriptional regulator [Mixta intestinalis]|jgi:LacI family repressor for deo operon, udp, cdd, tsx, nupC, and nupG|uniref:HTH-type transcriptional repressor CytR n=1 Tax=Mixta intestinalis TaxID=1615494 RepID=A0A6P1Q3J5_9GAMM|nr:LacI family DNA-binding transcriptional regulator [Mixta intestinalis]QHM73536.1 HTH-type transcriptional repressor CytR [Mixta intestinalis]